MSAFTHIRSVLAGATAGVFAAASNAALAAATIVIINVNGPGVGFNDSTPVAPVGGNTGTTLGQQRLNAFAHAANIWGATLTSNATIFVQAQFTALSCNANSAVLGSAGPTFVFRDFAGAPFAGTWYHSALADKLFGADLNSPAGVPDIAANFNVNLGQPGCLTGTPFYLGLDNNHGAAVDLVAVLLHEFGHGLGFSTTTSGTTGSFLSGFPSSYDHFALDNTTGLTWQAMTAAQRVASAVNTGNLVWSGANVTNSAPSVLGGTPELAVTGAFPAVNGTYALGTAAFGAPLTNAGVSADVMPLGDPANPLGCSPFNALDALAVSNNIALIDRGTCAFTVKVKNAQDAGARAAIIVNNVAGPAPGLGGADPTVTIPAVMLSQADGALLKSVLQFRSRTRSGVVGKIGLDPTQLAGADAAGRVMLFAPNPFQGGSSVSHFDVSALPNLLMEPSISADLTHSVIPPQDLTFKQLQDIGW